ncbi:hypothetical protein OC846_002066 [Tilletia horrida]|uniref:Aldehyde dehydrogenase domain-containing protein n=1 Tax=Tilletia horrida TaxID=155126 RepID=A0AAN6GXT9_9BASI|nr:hypothetical protein OC846_002066 [Tilletia horrida]KAK0568278.1 hypothetical protein OC861_002142 [Tilletia horrida]
MSAPPTFEAPKESDVELRAFISGAYVDVHGSEEFQLENPFTEEPFIVLKGSSEADVEDAFKAAKEAQPAWEALSALERATLVRNLAALLTRDAVRLGSLETVVTGKQMAVQLGPQMEGFINMIAGWAHNTLGKSTTSIKDMVGITSYKAYGVVACLMPYNAPTGKLAMGIVPALLAGNTVILKPSERNALGVIALGALFKEAGFPDGVVSIVPGGPKVGALLASHMGIRAITFTGSVAGGRAVAEAAARSNLKKVILELGGKSPALVFDDADVQVAVGTLSAGIRLFAGQMCVANSRIYVQESIAEAFKTAFLQYHLSHKPGDPWDLASDLGMSPINDKKAYDSALAFIESARAEGGQIHQGETAKTKGYFVPATVITGLSEQAKAVKEEIFANVVHLSTFKTEAEAIRVANDTEFGLYASVWTSNTDRALRCSQALEAGTVVVNGSAPTLHPDLPFGGWKQSGTGKELGPDCIKEFMQEKTVFIKYKTAP